MIEINSIYNKILNFPYWHYSQKINQKHIMFCILGTFIWLLGYALINFYWDYSITIIKKQEKFGKGYQYKYVHYQSFKKYVDYFSIFYLAILLTLIFLPDFKFYCISSGFIIFLIGYFIITGITFDFNQIFKEFFIILFFYFPFLKRKVSSEVKQKED